MILPYNGKTRVIFYIERKYKNLVAPIIQQFNELNEEEKLHFLFISLMISWCYSDYYMRFMTTVCPGVQLTRKQAISMLQNGAMLKLFTAMT